jgi:hypothetical protein
MAPSARRARSCTLPSTPSGICSLCASPRPPSRTARRWASWPGRCKK